MHWINEIRNFLEDYSGVYANDPDIDIYKDMGVVGDDFHDMIAHYTKMYDVDMSGYIWYFHTDEEGQSIGAMFCKPPYRRVKRIPVTPRMLADFIAKKKWDIHYPPHTLPKYRIDLIINGVVVTGGLVAICICLLIKSLS